MYLSLNSTTTAGRPPWPDFARLASKVGYPAVDVNITAAKDAGPEATSALLRDLKLRAGILTFPVDFRKDEETYKKDLAKLEEYAQFAVAIGCPRMTTWLLPSYPAPKNETKKLLLGRFRPAADILARSHVRLGIEFVSPVHLRKLHPYEFIWRMDEMLDFAKQCGPNVGLLVDSWHWHHAGATVADIVNAGSHNIVHVQINDSPDLPPDRIRDNERLMPGEGVIDLQAFVQALSRIGYRDAVSPEVFGRGLKDMTPEEGAKLSLHTAQAVMDKYLQTPA